MKRTHFWVGILGIIAFLLTGQYMDRYQGHLHGMADGPRMVFRSTHIYLLLASIVNVSLGLYVVWNEKLWRQRMQQVGSAFLLLGPCLLLVGFMREPWLSDFDRPYSRPALYGSLAGIVLHVIGGVLREKVEVREDWPRR